MFFLPGASGSGRFWQPVAQRLPDAWDKVLFDWPGLGDMPSDPRVQSFGDLAQLVLDRLDSPTSLVAQSLGGVVAMQVALARPDLVRRLVLIATSGGVDLRGFDLADWRPEYRAEYPLAASFITDEQPEDLSAQLAGVVAPTLLLWSKDDTISPPGVGRLLARHLSHAQPRLVVLDLGDHTFARDHAEVVTPLIAAHLA